MIRPNPAFVVLAALLLCSSLASCSSLKIVGNEPLEKLAGADDSTITKAGYRLPQLEQPEHDDILLILAFSGGGKRSSAFSFGALQALRDLNVVGGAKEHSLLSEIDIISSVSGGTFTSMYYGLHRDKLFTDYYDDFLKVDLESYIWGIYLLPWNWDWLVRPSVGTNDYMAQVYDELMFKGATYADLIDKGRPVIVADATDITYGYVFSFVQETFDLICSDLAELPLARATAASNGFPVLFSPITLVSYRKNCGDRLPTWYAAAKAEAEKAPSSRIAVAIRQAEAYLNAEQTQYIHLLDGGIADNLALRSLDNYIFLLAARPETIVENGFDHWRRVLVVSVDGEGDQDTSWARQRNVSSIGQILSNVSGAQIDAYNFETIQLTKEQVQLLSETLIEARCSQAKTINGYRCDDVKAEFVHLSLKDVQDPEVRKQLEAIPTGLTISEENLKLLIQSGINAVKQSEAIKSFLDVGESDPATN